MCVSEQPGFCLLGPAEERVPTSVVDLNPVGSGTFWPGRIRNNGTLPDPDLTFLTKNSVYFLHIFNQNGPFRL
jgi:hypothetical protein